MLCSTFEESLTHMSEGMLTHRTKIIQDKKVVSLLILTELKASPQ